MTKGKQTQVCLVASYLARADIVSQIVVSDNHLQVRVVLPGVSVGRILPATGPRGQLDARQQEAQAPEHLQHLGRRIAATWSGGRERRRRIGD